MTSEKEIIDWLTLSLIPGLGNESLRKLLSAFSAPENVLSASHTDLSKVVSPRVAEQIQNAERSPLIDTTLRWLEQQENHLITLADQDYPKFLLQISDPPPLLYLKGRRELLNRPSFAIVGSRNASTQGNINAEAFARSLSEAGLCIASGMAVGIDTSAHRGGLQGEGKTIAIVGTGLDIVYPARNRELAHQIAEQGALISEFPLNTPAIGGNFPRRNRIISGISLGCLVVEAAIQSGSLITARQALEQGREVFAIPGSIHSPLVKGCHALIKQGAKLVENATDILDELHWTRASVPIAPEHLSLPTSAAQMLLDHLGYDPCSVDALCARSGLTAEAASAMLLELELEGRVGGLPGGLYQRLQ